MSTALPPVLDGAGGGVYQYSETLLEAVAAWVDDGGNDELVVLAEDPESAVAWMPGKW